jgi:beta-glucosidase
MRRDPRDGDEVVFLFVQGPPAASGQRSVRELKSFARVHLAAGEKQTAALPLRIRDLRHWSGDANGSWLLDPGTYTLLVGPSDADDALTVAGTFTISG